MSSFKSNENIHKKEDGSYYVVSANKACLGSKWFLANCSNVVFLLGLFSLDQLFCMYSTLTLGYPLVIYLCRLGGCVPFPYDVLDRNASSLERC